MARQNVTLSAALVVLSTAAVCPSQAYAQQRAASVRQPVLQTASTNAPGGITGTVTDEHGVGLPGAMVSVLGATMAMDVTDPQGRFALAKLPAGDYVLRAHLQGFAASPREIVRIAGSSLPAFYRIQLRRLSSVAPTTTSDTIASRPILAAGFGLPTVADDGTPDTTAANAADKDDHPHGETAWRLRHLPRSVLKDYSNTVVITEGDSPVAESYFAKASSAGNAASSLSDYLPFSGEVNLLTTGTYAPGSFLSGDRLPRNVAYLAIGAPAGVGNWSVRAAMSQGDLASWLVGGSFASKAGGRHAYNLGMSYSAQVYQTGTPLTLTAAEASRNVGELYGIDRWVVVPGVSIDYGGNFARYDYLVDKDFFSPRAGLTLSPTKATRVRFAFAQQVVAPGAEEFLSPGSLGPWLPPERTFAALQGGDLRVERTRSMDFSVEHDFGASYVFGIRRFFDSIDDQVVTLFGISVPGAPSSVGHFYVANGGDVATEGWAVRLASPTGKRVRGSVDYSLTRARWTEQDRPLALGSWAPATVRPETESLQDITTTLQTNIPETSTRVFLLYKVNTGFTRSDLSLQHPGLDGRFDLQVNQALPFAVAGTQWEVLVGLRNLFRDPTGPTSVYDELLVVRPPKRVVGGFLVKF